MPEKLFDNKLGQVRLVRAVGQNEVRPSDKPKTNDLGYLLSNRPWNKVSGHDIIAKLSENRLRSVWFVRGGDSRELLNRALPQRYGKCDGIPHLQMARR